MTDRSVEEVAINRTVNRQWNFHAWMTLNFKLTSINIKR